MQFENRIHSPVAKSTSSLAIRHQFICTLNHELLPYQVMIPLLSVSIFFGLFVSFFLLSVPSRNDSSEEITITEPLAPEPEVQCKLECAC